MIEINDITATLKKKKIEFISGVPDSIFKDLCLEFENNFKREHIVAANEGSSIGLAIGYHLATNKIPIVYLQNSGLGNIVNPITSLASSKVYKIPMILIIGWRGEVLRNEQLKDEPQHKDQGMITKEMLKTLNIDYKILDKKSNFKKVFSELNKKTIKSSKPVAMLVRRNIFSKNKLKKISPNKNYKTFSREDALLTLLKQIPNTIPKISTTGMLSRELNEYNEKNNLEKNTFMCVGGMGHAVSVAAGVAFKKKTKVLCLDGDGAITMHLGSLSTSAKMKNIIHVVFNNDSHDSVGGQKTSSSGIAYHQLAKTLGYGFSKCVKDEKNLRKALKSILKNKKSSFLEIICSKGNRKDLSRPKKKMLTYKKFFKKFLNYEIR
jgi:phosphonopyruvate decarboxylase